MEIRDLNFRVFYGFYDSPFGRCLIGVTDYGALCYLAFFDGPDIGASFKLLSVWGHQTRAYNPLLIAEYGSRIFSKEPIKKPNLHLYGTPLQTDVWRALCAIPAGSTVSYEEIAHRIGKPKAVRAVANAIAANVIAYAIPCHRVVRKSGELGGYRWGVERKKEMLRVEAS